MRKILFRGKRLDNGEWVEGDLFQQLDGNKIIHYYDYFMRRAADIEPKTVGQYTGLKDRNGKKIFEGDILKIPYNDIGDDICKVIYQHDRFLGILPDGCEDSIHRNKEIEVIGNIFDNPELCE